MCLLWVKTMDGNDDVRNKRPNPHISLIYKIIIFGETNYSYANSQTRISKVYLLVTNSLRA